MCITRRNDTTSGARDCSCVSPGEMIQPVGHETVHVYHQEDTTSGARLFMCITRRNDTTSGARDCSCVSPGEMIQPVGHETVHVYHQEK